MRDLGYIIDYKEALEIKDHMALTLNIWGLPTQFITKNHSTYEIDHPNLEKQFGAIYLAGKDIDTIKAKNAVKFVEIRFFVAQLKLLNKYEEFLKLKTKYSSLITVKEDSILKFQFYELNQKLINELLFDIHSVLFKLDN
ncbi:hypothetical protein [Priestia aryabhattai]|uniref:hypothetical protein n=1 Tax=Priestia aryabhattai TaxID=412384 RepID=UPI0015F753F0|nr:hypothetical protein [Priestia aryabhattai]